MKEQNLAKGCYIDLNQVPEDKPQQDRSKTEKLDAVLLNRYLVFPIMILCFTILFAISFTLGKPISGWIGLLLDQAAAAIENSSIGKAIPDLLMSLFSNGILRGIGSALAFFPRC
jgi:ferrous iron transport protein B